MDLSIIIVHYKTPLLLLECVRSINKNTVELDLEVIIVDNDSQDNSESLIKDEFKYCKWVNSGYNAGFARANNTGIKTAKGEYILLLNPDTYIKGDFLKNMLYFYKKKDEGGKLGLLGCRIVSSIDGYLLVGSGIGFPSIKKYIKANPIYIYLTRNFAANKNKYDPQTKHYQNHEIDFVSGACVMIKKSKIVNQNLYLDEDFFLYSEDVEWSYRVKQKGFYNYFCASLEVYHVNSASTKALDSKQAQMQISEYLYYYKTLNGFGYFLLGKIIQFNFYLSKKLLQRKKESSKLITIEKEEFTFQKYFTLIPTIYKRKIDGGKNYLRYAE